MSTGPGKSGAGARSAQASGKNTLARAEQFDLFAPRARPAEPKPPEPKLPEPKPIVVEPVAAPLVRPATPVAVEPEPTAPRAVGPKIYSVGELTREIKGEL